MAVVNGTVLRCWIPAYLGQGLALCLLIYMTYSAAATALQSDWLTVVIWVKLVVSDWWLVWACVPGHIKPAGSL